jgi:hypothetical protein
MANAEKKSAILSWKEIKALARSADGTSDGSHEAARRLAVFMGVRGHHEHVRAAIAAGVMGDRFAACGAPIEGTAEHHDPDAVLANLSAAAGKAG